MVSFKLPIEHIEKVERLAVRTGTSKTHIVRLAIENLED